MKEYYVVGHRNPDTDSICSAIAYASLKNILDKRAKPYRLGPLNEETKYVLKRFNVEVPDLIDDARSQLKDIDIDLPSVINQTCTVKEAWKKLLDSKMHALCVTNNNRLIGYVTSSTLSSLRTTSFKQIAKYMESASVLSIAKTIKGEVVVDQKNLAHNGYVYIITLLSSDEFKNNVKDSICILSDNTQNQIKMIESGAKCLVIACNKKIEDSVIELAKDKKCAIIKTSKDSMAIAQVINESFPIEHIMTKNITTFNEKEYVEDVLKKLLNYRYRSFPVVDNDNNLIGVISRFHLLKYRKKSFILVDHSAQNQSIPNITKARIEEIIDHHHIGNIQTDHPIYYRNQVCGCSATIVFQMYEENGVKPSKSMAGIMLGAIISDTLNFKSATTTKLDISVAKKLAEISEENLESYALDVLGASVSLLDSSMEEILNRDLKEYEIESYKIAVGQTNYYKVEDLQSILPSFKKHLQNHQKQSGCDLVLMMFTNVSGEGSMIVYGGTITSVITSIVETEIDECTGYDSSLISRKQQLIPKLLEAVRSL